MILEFNNGNTWEITEFNDSAGQYIVCLNRKGKYTNANRVNEDSLYVEGAFPYSEWKTFFINPEITTERLEEQDYPMAYYAMFVMGYPVREKQYPTKYIFHRGTL